MGTEAAQPSAQATTNADAKPNPVQPPALAADAPPAENKPAEGKAAAQEPAVQKTLVTGLEGGAGDGQASGDPANATPKPEDDKQVVPEKYELKLAENSPLSAARLDAIAAEAKAKGLSNEAAQELVAREEGVVSGYVKGLHETMAERQTQWIDTVKNDKEIGGDNFKEAVHYSNQFVKKFGSENLIKELELSGLGNHPEVVRMFSRAGRAMANDKRVNKGVESKPEKSAAEIFYGNTQQT